MEFEAGSFDWRTVAFRVSVPDDARDVQLALGLEQVAGKVWYDDVRVTVYRSLRRAPRPVATGPVYKGHSLKRLRGAMISPNVSEEDLRVLGQEWNANLIRWQLIRTGRFEDSLDLKAYDAWLQGELAKLDRLLPACEKYGLRVALDLHSPPGGKSTSGGYAGSDNGLFTDAACQDRFVTLWQEIARKYKDNPVIWGYDLANEPVEAVTTPGLLDWQELASEDSQGHSRDRCGARDYRRAAPWGSPDGLLRSSHWMCRMSSTACICTFRTSSRIRTCTTRRHPKSIRAKSADGIGTKQNWKRLCNRPSIFRRSTTCTSTLASSVPFAGPLTIARIAICVT